PRPHSGRSSPVLESGPAPVDAADVDEALAAERVRLGADVDLQAEVEDLARLGVGGQAAAQALREMLAARSGQDLRQGRVDAATHDDHGTPAVDEHSAVGMAHSGRGVDDANRYLSTSEKT